MTTNVNIQNGTDATLTMVTGVTPSLSTDYWSIYASVADGNAKTAVLWMDRNQGITNGDTWVFTTAFTFDDTAIQLMEQLTGTRTSSDIKIRITAGTHDSGWTDADTSVQFTGGDGTSYEFNGTFFANGTYDDVTYSLLAV